MLEVRNLSVGYQGEDIISDVNLKLDDDEILMLVGPTGCGKTTLLRALAGLIRPRKGEIRIGSLRIDRRNHVPPEKRRVGMVFQDFALFPHLDVAGNVGFRLKDPEPVDRWLRFLGLESLRHAMPQTLSGGQKQRVSLARSLAHSPELILLDEPLSNLDAALKDSLRWEIRSVLKAAGVPAIWVTHDQEEALSVGDRVGILNGGRLEQLDTPETCFCQPASRFVAGFLGEATFLPGRLRDGMVNTVLGSAPAVPMDGASDQVDLLVRPDDLALTVDAQGDGTVEWSKYEGGTRLYGVSHPDGLSLRVRVSHEIHLSPGDRVSLKMVTTHPLAAFRRQTAEPGDA